MKAKILRHSSEISILYDKYSSVSRALKDTINSSKIFPYASTPTLQNCFIARLNFQSWEKNKNEIKIITIKKNLKKRMQISMCFTKESSIFNLITPTN